MSGAIGMALARALLSNTSALSPGMRGLGSATGAALDARSARASASLAEMVWDSINFAASITTTTCPTLTKDFVSRLAFGISDKIDDPARTPVKRSSARDRFAPFCATDSLHLALHCRRRIGRGLDMLVRSPGVWGRLTRCRRAPHLRTGGDRERDVEKEVTPRRIRRRDAHGWLPITAARPSGLAIIGEVLE